MIGLPAALGIVKPAAAAGGGPTDPHFANVSLLLHFDGPDGSTTFTDSSANALSPTVVGNAQIDTAQSRFGGASYLGDGSGDGLVYAASALFGFEGGEFTVESWVRVPTLGTRYLWAFGTASGTNSLRINSNGSLTVVMGGSLLFSTAAGVASAGTWHFAGLRRSGTVVELWVDGVLVGSAAYAANVGASNKWYVGCTNDTAFNSLNGWLDDQRVTKGVARDLSAVPTAPFPDA